MPANILLTASGDKGGGWLRQVIGVDTHTIVSHDAQRYAFLKKYFRGRWMGGA